VLHKGYWKYKPEHFTELQQKISKGRQKPPQGQVAKEFADEMTKAQNIVKVQTDLEKKYEGTDRFKFSDSQLSKYEEAKAEREAKRMERRLQHEREIKEENERLEKQRQAEKERIEQEEREYEAMKEKERQRLKDLS
jgi:hypothetical protein